jgi:hypothetical protein
MKKEIISESRLREIISEEAARFKKKLTLEAEKKNLLKKLNEMYMEEDVMDEDVMEGDELDEANMITRFFNRTMGGKAQFEERMNTLSRSAKNNYGVEFTDAEKDELRAKAKADGYGGSLNFTELGPNMKLVYTDAYDAKDTSGSVTSIAREGYAMEEDTLDEVDLNAAAHKEAIEFVNNHPKKDSIKMTYDNGKKDKASLLKFNNFVLGYAKNTLKKNNAGASAFLQDVVRVLEGKIDAKVHTNTPSTFGE